MSFVFRRKAGVTFLTSGLLNRLSDALIPGGFYHAFSTRQGGVSDPPWDSLNLGTGRGDRDDAVQENYRRFFAALGGNYDSSRAVLTKQVHGTTVRNVTAADAGKGLSRPRDYDADALITMEPDLPLFVFSADCGTILLADARTGAVGAVHAGWRGCAGGIPYKAVAEMSRLYGSRPEDIYAAVGPCIGSCCFETDEDVPEAMRKALGAEAEMCLIPPDTSGEKDLQNGKWHVDLSGLNRLWLLRAGVPEKNIDVCSLCTGCHPELFWSYRKTGNARGAQVAAIVRLREKHDPNPPVFHLSY